MLNQIPNQEIDLDLLIAILDKERREREEAFERNQIQPSIPLPPPPEMPYWDEPKVPELQNRGVVVIEMFE